MRWRCNRNGLIAPQGGQYLGQECPCASCQKAREEPPERNETEERKKAAKLQLREMANRWIEAKRRRKKGEKVLTSEEAARWVKETGQEIPEDVEVI